MRGRFMADGVVEYDMTLRSNRGFYSVMLDTDEDTRHILDYHPS